VFRKEVYLEIQRENTAPGTPARAEVNEALGRLTQLLADAPFERL